jgi:hypothetical protein
LLVGVNLYHMVFEATPAHLGVGSVVWVVAPELSLVSVKEPLVSVMFIALAKLSFAGAGAITTKVGKVTDDVVTVVPPPGGGFSTPTEFVLPKLAMKLAGIVAVSCVGLTNVVAMGVPPRSGFINTLEVDEKPVPFTVIVVAFEFTAALAGLTGELIVGGPPRTVNVSPLPVVVATLTVTCGVPDPLTSEAGIVAVNWESLTGIVVTAEPFHCTVPPVNPFPLTVNVNWAEPVSAETGEIEERWGPPKVKLFSTMSHAPRP